MTPKSKRAITRQRDHLSCVECRRKKLKCDRAVPCSTCVKRDGGGTCNYQRASTDFEAEREKRRKAEGRLEHLEQLVQRLSRSDHREQPPHDRIERPPAQNHLSTGTTKDDHNSTELAEGNGIDVYDGATHWTAMLEDIAELRSNLNSQSSAEVIAPPVRTSSIEETPDDVAILFGAGPILTYEQVLSQCLPPRQDSDRMVALYFRSKAVKAPFLHHAHFQRLYSAFWAAPLTSPPLWTSILFSVFHASVTSLSVPVVTDNRYAVAAARCLAIGKHYQPKEHAVEALLLYAQTKCFNRLDITPDIGGVFSMASRSALRMGYHCDPGRLSISPFEQEMRRRAWSALLQLDLLTSFQLGLPSSILPGCHDTRIPANLQDADFNEETSNIPASRPDTEETDIMFYIAKHRLSVAFEKVLHHISTASSTSANAEFAIEALDAEIRHTFLALPEQYRAKAVSASIFDSPTLIVARFCVNMIYEKCLAVLHRPYVATGRRESVLACATASTNIIRTFLDVYREFQPGGQVEMQRWFMSAITWHDFLLAVTALCLVICSASRHGMASAVDPQGLMALLGSASEVLQEHSHESRDTAQVEKVVHTVRSRYTGMADVSSNQEPAVGIAHITPDSTTNGDGRNLPIYDFEPDMSMDWAPTLSQPMVDESWNWLETFLQDDTLGFANGSSMSLPET